MLRYCLPGQPVAGGLVISSAYRDRSNFSLIFFLQFYVTQCYIFVSSLSIYVSITNMEPYAFKNNRILLCALLSVTDRNERCSKQVIHDLIGMPPQGGLHQCWLIYLSVKNDVIF